MEAVATEWQQVGLLGLSTVKPIFTKNATYSSMLFLILPGSSNKIQMEP
jgi:hypothetical protein